MMPIPREPLERIRRRLVRLYGEGAEALVERLCMTIGRYGVGREVASSEEFWNENEVILITYPDVLRKEGEQPLVTLGRFLEERLHGAFKTVHILPFYPWSSDDGFSVIDYRTVSNDYGTWSDVENIGKGFRLMFDLVLNHCSTQSRWFRNFTSGIQPASRYFIECDPSTDLSAVTRPRNSPLLTEVDTLEGEKHVWTTFSRDQVDLNWANPDVLFEFLDILVFYLSKGVHIVRLDAVAFLWKRIGTACFHLPETHEIVKLFRDVLEIVAPHVVLLTETNVPHDENISYFGDGDEAQMVYQFSLPPLLLYSLLRENCAALRDWAARLRALGPGASFMNFTASHDGIGVRPLQGLIPEEEIAWLLEQVMARGGRVSRRRVVDGSESPYEMNITYCSALSEPGDETLGLDRFFCSQAVALSLRGVPAVYFPSLIGEENDLAGVERRGYARAINRRKWRIDELEALLASPDSRASQAFERYLAILNRRANHPAFHPHAGQTVLDFGEQIFAFKRVASDDSEKILCLFNVTRTEQALSWDRLCEALEDSPGKTTLRNLLSGLVVQPERERGTSDWLTLQPYEACWLAT